MTTDTDKIREVISTLDAGGIITADAASLLASKLSVALGDEPASDPTILPEQPPIIPQANHIGPSFPEPPPSPAAQPTVQRVEYMPLWPGAHNAD